MIITPSAKDIARELGIKIIYEPDLPRVQGENSGDFDIPPARLDSGKTPPSEENNLKLLEGKIEKIVLDILLARSGSLSGHERDGEIKENVLMLNFPENRVSQRDLFRFILDNGFRIKHLHSHSMSGLCFMIFILESRFATDKCDYLIDSLKEKFRINVLIS